MDRADADGFEPPLEAVDMLGAELLRAVDLRRRVVEKGEEALEPVGVLDDRAAHHGRGELAQGRGEGERQPPRAQVNEVDQGAAAMRRLDREAQANDGVGLLREDLASARVNETRRPLRGRA